MATDSADIFSWSPPRRLRVDEETIKRTCSAFDIDPADTLQQTISGLPETHPRLSESNLHNLFRSLAERHDKRTTRRINRLVNRWKDGTSTNQTDAFEYESIAKDALELDAPVRYSNGRSYSVSDIERNVYKDLYRVSQAFFSYNYGPDETLAYRGIRNLSVAKIFAQVFDNPGASRYEIDTSAISNFTATRDVANEYSNGIVLRIPLPREHIAMMVDHVFNTGTPEDEIHVTGGTFSLPPECVIHTGEYSGDERKAATTSKRLEDPEGLSFSHLEDVFSILEIMGAREIGVRSKEGRDKIDNWFSEYKKNIPDADIDRVRPLVEYVKRVDKDKRWG